MPDPSRKRPNLNEAVRETLVDWILGERLRPGDRFNETRIAERLGVSQTPIREALFRLAGEGIVTAERGEGFRLRHLDEQGFRDLHGLVAGLETLAFRACPAPTATKIRKLRTVNGALARSESRRRTVVLDHDWHFTLVGDCANGLTLEKIRSTKILTFSYALAYWDLTGTLEMSVEQHARVADALEAGELEAAERLLAGNWLETTQTLLDGLRARSEATRPIGVTD